MAHTSATAQRVLSIIKLRVGDLIHEAAKFGVVGLAAMVIDVGLFNLLMYGGGQGLLSGKPLTAKVVSVVAAATFAYFGNRFWTFRDRASTGHAREYVLFFALNGIGMGIALGCLWLSHYAFGLTSPLADNISANGVGLVLGTLFRFFSYRKWVFRKATTEQILAFAEV